MATTRRQPPTGAQRIDYKMAEQMLRSGATQREVAEKFGVTQAAISRAVTRGAIKHEYTSYAQGRSMPWHIREEHQNKYLARMLRAHHRKEQGLTSAPPLERMLESFLRSAEEQDFVITYDPDTEDGFFRVPRRPGVDDLPLIRRDDLDDKGRPVRRRRSRSSTGS